MRTFSVSVVFLAVLIVQTIGADNKELEDVEKFIQQEIDKDHGIQNSFSEQLQLTISIIIVEFCDEIDSPRKTIKYANRSHWQTRQNICDHIQRV